MWVVALFFLIGCLAVGNFKAAAVAVALYIAWELIFLLIELYNHRKNPDSWPLAWPWLRSEWVVRWTNSPVT